MKRGFGIFLIAVGAMLAIVAIVIWAATGSIAGGMVVFGLSALAFAGAYYAMRGTQPAGKTTPGSAVGSFLADVVERRSIGMLNYEVFFQTPVAGQNGRPSMLIVRLPVETPATLQFHPEGWFDRLGKRLRIAREVQTGDPAFDDTVYVRGLSESYAADYLGDADKRAGITALLHAGFGEVKLTGTTIEAVWLAFDPLKNDRAGLTENAAQALAVLASRLPVVEPDFVEPADRCFVWYVVFWIMTGLFAASGVAMFIYPPIYVGDLFWGGLEMFAWAFFGLAFVSAMLLRGWSVSHDRWGMLVGVGFFLIAAGSFGSFAAANALLDEAPADERVAVIVDKRVSRRSKGGTSYYASVPSWDHPGERVEFSIGASEHDRIVVGRSKMRLLVGQGRLGIAWLKSQAVEF